MVTVAIDEQMVHQLTTLARTRATSVERLAEKAIRNFLRVEAEQILAREAQAFVRLHAELLAQYPTEYVAIRRGQVVDHDADQATLYLRIAAQFPDEIVLIRQVRSEVERTYTIRSPRLGHE